MALDAGIYGNLLARPRSAMEYQQDYAAMDDAKAARQVNALALQEKRAQLADAETERQQKVGYNNLLMQSAGKPAEELVASLERAGNPYALKQAQELRKAQLDDQVKRSTLATNNQTLEQARLKAQAEKHDQAINDVLTAQDPKQAMTLLQRYSQAIKPEALQGMTRELMGVQTADQLEAWKQRRLDALIGAKGAAELAMKRLELQAKQRDSASTLANRELVIGPDGQPRVNQPYVDAKASVARAGVQPTLMAPITVQLADGTQALYQPGNKPGQQGQIIKVDGKNAAPSAKPAAATEGERNASGYYGRMVEATKLLDQFEASGKATYGTQAAGAIPFVGAAAQGAAMTPEQQQYKQAQEDWVRAKLRKESGASIAADEMQKEVQTYFPQPWDKPATREQKRKAREVANRGMRNSAGVEASLVDQQTGRIDPGAPSASRIGGAQPAFGLDPSAIDAELARRKGK